MIKLFLIYYNNIMVKSLFKKNITPRKIIMDPNNGHRLAKQNKGRKKLSKKKESPDILLNNRPPQIYSESDANSVIQSRSSENKKVINIVEDHIKLNKICHDLIELDKKVNVVSKKTNHHRLSKLNKNMKILNQKVDCVIDEMDSMECKKNDQYKYKEVNVKCQHITFSLNTNAIMSDHMIEICGTISEFKVKINQVKGELEFSNCIIPSEIDDNNSCGFIHIHNLDNNNLYLATIYPKCNKLYYVFSNRPIIPLGIYFNSIISINIKISYL